MKRFLSFLFIFACLLTIVPPAFAANTITVTAQVPPDWGIANVFFWDADDNGSVWPGEPMTKGADGRYTVEIPAGFTKIIINNWQDYDGIQTGDLAMSGDEDVWIVFDGTDASIYTSDPGIQNYTPPSPPDSPFSGETVTIHARFPMTQSSPHLWAWQDNYRNDINAFDTWPGQPMTPNGDWWITQMPVECDNIIFNDGGMYQTPDTPVEAGRDIWAVVHSDWTVDIYYSAPDVPSGFPDELYIVGEGLPGVDAWDPYDHNGLMTGEDGVYQISFDVSKGSSMIFMFCGNGRWDSGYVYGSAASTVDARPDNYYLLNEDGGDFTYQSSKDCTLTVTVDLANGYVTLREQAVETVSHYTIHAKIHTADRPSLYAWGHDCYNMIWPGEKMYKDGDWYTLEISANNDYFNIVGGTNSTDDIEIPSSGTEFWVVCDSDWEYTISSTPPASSLPTVKFHVYAPDATKLSISFEETDDGIFHYVQMERSGKKGWWECTVFTDLGFTVNGDVDCLKEHPLTLPGVTEETWVVLDEEGDHTVSREEPALSKGDNKKKSNKSSDEEVDDQPPVILFVLIGVGVVALAGIAVLVVLIIRKRR